MNIAEILAEHSHVHGDAPALIEVRVGHDRTTTFRELEAASARIAAQLAQSGVAAGDAVLVMHGMSAELYAFLIGLFRIGAVAIFVDPSAGWSLLDRCLQNHPPKAFFGSLKAHLLRLRIPALRRVGLTICTSPLFGSLYISFGSCEPELRTIAAADDSAPALITFTSGSTGAAKGAVRTHGFLIAQHRALAASLHHRAGSMDLTTLPVFVLANLASGIASVIPHADMRRPGHIAPRPVLGQLQRLPIATMAASPAFVSRIAAECIRSGRRISRLERVFMGGAPVFPEDLRQARDAFPRADITAVYGSTEAEPMAEIALSAISSSDFCSMAQGRGLLAGNPVPSVSLRILRDQWGVSLGSMNPAQFRSLHLGPEAIGEIVVSGEHVLKGYLDGSGDSENKLHVDGTVWHRTGDLGWLDNTGRLWLMGRAASTIRDERGVVYPFAVECAARQIAGVRRAAVLTIERRRIMVVEAESRTSANSIREAMTWADLDEIRTVHAIPMDKRHNAKIDYVSLRHMLAEGR